MKKDINYLKRCLNLHWLRPDNALWIFEFQRVFGKTITKNIIEGKSLEVGCGDGTTTFKILGGEFDPEFDVYKSTQIGYKNMSSSPKFLNTGSIKDEKGDFYNVYNSNWKKVLSKNLIKKPKTKFTFGTDWKPALLKKAADLNIYKKLILMDANKIPWKIFQSNSINFIFSTMLYWLQDPAKVLRELNRISTEDGLVAFSAPMPDILKVTSFSFLKKYNYPLTNRLDRGRHKNWKRHAKSFAWWKKVIKKSGYKIIKYSQFQPALQIAFGESIVRTYLKAYEKIFSVKDTKTKKVLYAFKKEFNKENLCLASPFLNKTFYAKTPKTYHAFVIKKIK